VTGRERRVIQKARDQVRRNTHIPELLLVDDPEPCSRLVLEMTIRDPGPISYELYALMLRRGDPAFRLAVNRVLARLYRSGQILEIYTHWFGRIGTPSALLLSLYAIEGVPE